MSSPDEKANEVDTATGELPLDQLDTVAGGFGSQEHQTTSGGTSGGGPVVVSSGGFPLPVRSDHPPGTITWIP